MARLFAATRAPVPCLALLLASCGAHRPMTAPILDLTPPPADARIAYGGAPQQFGDLRLPKAGSEGPHAVPVAIVIHGGYWRSAYGLEHIGHLCAALTHAGVATWNLEYRRIGDPGGGWPAAGEDVLRGAEYLRTLAQRYPLDLTRVVAIGIRRADNWRYGSPRSTRSHCAAWFRWPESTTCAAPGNWV